MVPVDHSQLNSCGTLSAHFVCICMHMYSQFSVYFYILPHDALFVFVILALFYIRCPASLFRLCDHGHIHSIIISHVSSPALKYTYGNRVIILQLGLVTVEKELSELLKEVFDDYESDTSETLVTADTGIEPDDMHLLSADDIDTPTNRSSRDPVPRTLRSMDREKDDGDGDNMDTGRISQRDAEFHYPGHIPPLKYVAV